MDGNHLHHWLERAAELRPDHPAVEDEHGESLSYRALAYRSDRLATRLNRWGVSRGDRVGLWLPKCLEAVTTIHGVLQSGAAYVPVDPTAPVSRSATILASSGVKVVVTTEAMAELLRAAWTEPGPLPRFIVVGPHQIDTQDITPVTAADARWDEVMADETPSPLPATRELDDLAYILFTSGSTGRPKGVMLSHGNASCFLDWCQQSLGPWAEDDRFSSHAPFHFDLSVFDLFSACRNAATLVLIGETRGKDPAQLGDFLMTRRISVWYSAPSILSLLAEHGRLDRPGFPSPRLVLFAGEVFPVSPLRQLRRLWPRARFWNLYGPTETNVCTAMPIPDEIPEDRTTPYPIGRECRPLRARVVDEQGRDVPTGNLGELVIAGPGVMKGYFGQPELTGRAFLTDESGINWYRTGDLVAEDASGCLQFHGRRDRMIKRRGHRIELGEIESALYRHDGVDRAAVVAREGETGVAITAFVSLKPGHKKSIIAMKRHCTTYLPHSMIPDTITFVNALPATSTDKVDYQRLKAIATGQGAGV